MCAMACSRPDYLNSGARKHIQFHTRAPMTRTSLSSTKSVTCQSWPAAAICSLARQCTKRERRHDPHLQARLRRMGRGSVIPLSLPHSSIGYFTTPSSFRSRVRVIASVSTPILYPCCYQKRHALSRPIAARSGISACAGGSARLSEQRPKNEQIYLLRPNSRTI